MNGNSLEDTHEGMAKFFGIPRVEEPKYSEIRVALRQKNKASEMIACIGLYLLAYIIVLVVCGGIQYFTECQGGSYTCGFNMTGFNTIIVTTSYVLTPIVAIIGFLSWKKQHNKQTISQLSKNAYDLLSSQNLIAFRFIGYITNSYEDGANDQIMHDLRDVTNNTFDLIRLICKITNNIELEHLNEQNRANITAIVVNSDRRFNDGVLKENATQSFYAEYQTYVDTMKKIREELSDYILI